MLEKDRKKPARRRVAPKAAPKTDAAAAPEPRTAAPVAPVATPAARPAATASAPSPAPRAAGTAPAAAPRAVSAAERQRMVAEAAYYRATKRGFGPGDPVRDWIEAEAEIDAQLLGRS